jgi:hypothetical protein
MFSGPIPKYGKCEIQCGKETVMLRRLPFTWWIFFVLARGSLEVKLPTIWTDEKQSRAEAERRERLEDRRVEEKESEERRCRCTKRWESCETLFFQ